MGTDGITYAGLKIRLKAIEPAWLPQYKGAVIRGGFGLAFRRVSCPFRNRDCKTCLLLRQCVWTYIFDTPRPAHARVMPKSETVPHPFVVEPPQDDRTRLDPGEELIFGLTLIGRAQKHLPYFICAFEQMAEQGLGTGRAKFRLSDVTQNGELLYDGSTALLKRPLQAQRLSLADHGQPASAVTLRFLTPTRIVHQGRIARRPQFHVLLRSLLRRLWLLAYFHEEPLKTDHRPMIAAAEGIRLADAALAGDDWRHYSFRQKRVIEREGVTGWVTYEGDLSRFLPYLRAGEILHIGKGTTFGMGKYEMEVR